MRRAIRAGSVAGVLVAATIGASCSTGWPYSGGSAGPQSSGSSEGLQELQEALAGDPDASIQAGMVVLAAALTAEDWAYLSYAQWPSDDGSAALTDPTLQKAVKALRAAGTVPMAVRAPHLTATVHVLAGGLSAASYPSWLADYPEAMRLMQNRNGKDYAGTPGAATAFVKLLGVDAGNSPLPNPTMPADGVVSGCGASFYDFPGDGGSGSGGPNCSTIAFCCQGLIDINSGTTVCNDFTSCRGKNDGTLAAGGEDSGSDAASGGDGGGLVWCCQHGANGCQCYPNDPGTDCSQFPGLTDSRVNPCTTPCCACIEGNCNNPGSPPSAACACISQQGLDTVASNPGNPGYPGPLSCAQWQTPYYTESALPSCPP